MVINAVENFKKVQSTEFNINATYTLYIHLLLFRSPWRMVFVLSLWFLLPASSCVWRNFMFSQNKLAERSLKCVFHSVGWMGTEMQLKTTFPVTTESSFSHHSVISQSSFSQLTDLILWWYMYSKQCVIYLEWLQCLTEKKIYCSRISVS